MNYNVHIKYIELIKGKQEEIDYTMHFNESQGVSSIDIRNIVVSIGNGGFLMPMEDNEENMEFISSERIVKIWYEEIKINVVKPDNIVNLVKLKKE